MQGEFFAVEVGEVVVWDLQDAYRACVPAPSPAPLPLPRRCGAPSAVAVVPAGQDSGRDQSKSADVDASSKPSALAETITL